MAEHKTESAHALIGLAHDAGAWVGSCMCGAETTPQPTEQAARVQHSQHVTPPGTSADTEAGR